MSFDPNTGERILPIPVLPTSGEVGTVANPSTPINVDPETGELTSETPTSTDSSEVPAAEVSTTSPQADPSGGLALDSRVTTLENELVLTKQRVANLEAESKSEANVNATIIP
jgi:hypothetical protein